LSKILTDQWAAGFFEGEGYAGLVRMHKKYKYPRLSLTVCQINREPLDAFKEIVGVGKVRGPYGPYHANKKAYFQFNAHNADAEIIIEKLRPYLFQKGDQVSEALNKYRSAIK
jgi:hypothetical protein